MMRRRSGRCSINDGNHNIKMEITLDEIAKASSGKLFSPHPLKKIRGVSIDSRSVKPGELFIPLKGEHTDGHAFLDEAKKKGAGASLIRKNFPFKKIPEKFSFIKVHSPLRALGDIGRWYRTKFDIPIVAITGSCGKTTVKEMVYGLLSTRFRVLKNEGNFNNAIGLPLTIFRLNPGHEMAVLEMGTNSPGEIAYLGRITRPEIAVITNINPVHLEGLGTVDGVRREKESLLSTLSEKGRAVINYDDRYLKEARKKFRGTAITFGLGKGADFRADKIEYRENGLTFRLNCGRHIFIPFFGKANIYNALASMAVASFFDIPPDEMKRAFESMEGLPQRLKIFKKGDITIIDDTYNANPASFRAAVDTLTSLRGRGRCMVVAGDMLELGLAASTAHLELGYYIGKKGVNFLIVSGRWKRDLKDGAAAGGLNKKNIILAEPGEISRIILKMIMPCDKILIKASRKMEFERVVNVISSSLPSR